MASMTLEDLSSQLKKIDFCMLSTNAGSGRISARPMSNNGDVEYDGDSWFFSYEDSRKITEIEGIDTVLLTFHGAAQPPRQTGDFHRRRRLRLAGAGQGGIRRTLGPGSRAVVS
ncbi:pyridoxamine 5'-phosphate oxidase family protein [Rhizobium leguminosarum]|uniref:pyridoxamine 5'-phosphate oxidase family protein n=1 Tax=Rhizobium leguminosarum TaxID=384 RepID=UPI001FDF06CB|nr:pyridoxamine 5'-phosphate oxidase family protein [Rhizobium leguminosarum]